MLEPINMHGVVPVITESRSESDKQAFREAHRLLVAFGISAIPATLMLGLMRVDFLEGDFGPAGTLAMTLAGGTSIVCAVSSVVARRAWAAGATLDHVFAVMCWPLVLTLVGLCVSLFAYATGFSFLLDRS